MQGHDTDRQNLGFEWAVTCVQCGKIFYAKRSDASFCGSGCRNKYSREEKQTVNQIEWMKNDITRFTDKMVKGRFKKQFQDLARWIIKTLDNALSECETSDELKAFSERVNNGRYNDLDKQ